jgi:hypothetical protein
MQDDYDDYEQPEPVEIDDGYDFNEDEPYDYDDESDMDDDTYASRVFANAGSALRAAGPGNPRDLPCPTCKRPNLLTPADRARHYQCDRCADQAEGGGY